LFHSGWDGGIVTPNYDEDATKKIAETVEGFDIIFFGHDHTERNVTTDNGVLCLDPSNNALKVADATIELTKQNGHWKITRKEGQLADVRKEPIDEQFVRHFQPSVDNVKNYVNRRICFFTRPIRSRDCFFGSAPFTDFIQNL
jgi:2',3'-cyclic-nucleotide 2'-phosphodiesterase/3'-nucleotidase